MVTEKLKKVFLERVEKSWRLRFPGNRVKWHQEELVLIQRVIKPAFCCSGGVRNDDRALGSDRQVKKWKQTERKIPPEMWVRLGRRQGSSGDQ